MTLAAKLVKSWVGAPENTARSVLVTIFGDTVLPVATSLWLSQLFQLTDGFGFSGRLVRTSMFRLAAEGWFTNERVGRQSRYSLTPLAIEESAQAEERIYRSPHPDWGGTWTVVFLDAPAVPDAARDRLAQHLRWQGFISLTRGTVASPTASLASAADLCHRVAPECHVPLASMEFSELDTVVADGFFVQALAIDDMAKSYEQFISFYEPLVASGFDGGQAFVLRSMLIHDLRRIRLNGPDIPTALLPAEWPGSTAYDLATTLYPQLSAAASPWLADILETPYPTLFGTRFA